MAARMFLRGGPADGDVFVAPSSADSVLAYDEDEGLYEYDGEDSAYEMEFLADHACEYAPGVWLNTGDSVWIWHE